MVLLQSNKPDRNKLQALQLPIRAAQIRLNSADSATTGSQGSTSW
jgi:hypothetical protein